MNLHLLLFTRTLSKDYRWIVLPDFLSADTISIANKLHELLEQHHARLADKEKLRPLFLIKLPSALVLFEFATYLHEDAHGRTIRGIQGVCVSPDEARALWYALPHILTRRDYYLDAWRLVEFADADLHSRLDISPIEISLDQATESMRTSALEPDGRVNQIGFAGPLQLPYSREGYRELITIVSSPYMPLCNIAFGRTPEMLRILPDIGVVAQLQSHTDAEKGKHNTHDASISDMLPISRIDHMTKEIECEFVVASKSKFWLGVLALSKCYYFEVRVTGPASAESLIQSQCFDLQDGTNDIPNNDLRIQRAHSELCSRLLMRGWQRIPSRISDPWWKSRFRKQSSAESS